jgi:CUB domain
MDYYSDYVYVYDGYNTSAPLIALVTGSQSSLNYRTSQRYMFVRFTSGASSSYTGFNATYIAYIEPSTYMRMTTVFSYPSLFGADDPALVNVRNLVLVDNMLR